MITFKVYLSLLTWRLELFMYNYFYCQLIAENIAMTVKEFSSDEKKICQVSCYFIKLGLLFCRRGTEKISKFKLPRTDKDKKSGWCKLTIF